MFKNEKNFKKTKKIVTNKSAEYYNSPVYELSNVYGMEKKNYDESED